VCSSDLLEGAMSATGKKFADRFPGRTIFCPDYKRFFMDEEHMLFAQSLGRFYHNPDKIKLVHHHPVLDPSAIDETHHEVRKYLPADQKTYLSRKKLGYLWGRTLTRINE
jgi:hypothetical protein